MFEKLLKIFNEIEGHCSKQPNCYNCKFDNKYMCPITNNENVEDIAEYVAIELNKMGVDQ